MKKIIADPNAFTDQRDPKYNNYEVAAKTVFEMAMIGRTIYFDNKNSYAEGVIAYNCEMDVVEGSDYVSGTRPNPPKEWKAEVARLESANVIDEDGTFTKDYHFSSFSQAVRIISNKADMSGWISWYDGGKSEEGRRNMGEYRLEAYHTIIDIINSGAITTRKKGVNRMDIAIKMAVKELKKTWIV